MEHEVRRAISGMRLKLVRLAIWLVLFLVCAVGFVKIADNVADRDILGFDEAVLHGINGHATSFWDNFFVAFTQLGGTIGIATLVAGLLLLLLYRRKYQEMLIVGAGMAGTAILNLILKLIFERPRPDLWDRLVTEHSFSFPSGHAMISAALGLAVVVICWPTRYRWYAVAASAVYVILIGFSRLYLGVHYPSDVLAGWFVSGAWLLIVAVTIWSEKFRFRPKHKPTDQ